MKEAVDHIISKIGERRPEIGIVCGSGLGIIGDSIEDAVTLDYNDVPYLEKNGK